VFVEKCLEKQEGGLLTFNAAYFMFLEFLKRNQMSPLKRSRFKPIFAPLIRDQFELGLRNDLIGEKQKQTCGWKNLRMLELPV